jgi:hypothetical protein
MVILSISACSLLRSSEVMRRFTLLYELPSHSAIRDRAGNYFVFVKSVCGNQNVTRVRRLAGDTVRGLLTSR